MPQGMGIWMLRWTVAVVLLLSLTGATSASGASLQPIGAFAQPIFVTSDPGNPNRLFVVERGGTIELVQSEATSPFTDLSSSVACPSSCLDTTERGLLSMALAPDFDTTGHFYVYYATGNSGVIHIDQLTADGNRADPTTQKSLLSIPHSDATNHNGGQLQFGPDGNLYISTGDGGGYNDEFHNSQDLTKPLGKILRIRPNPGGPAPYYTVPSDNPFAKVAGDYGPIWSYGLRNPFRFSFDRLTEDIAIGDVGQDAEEEVDYAPAPELGKGANYGWNCREGMVAGPATDPQCTANAGGFTSPVFSYSHSDPGSPCAIIGGYVARDASLGTLYGRYLYADLCTGEIRSLELGDPFTSDSSTGLHVDNVNSFGEDSCGRLYVVSGNGEVDRLVGEEPASCPPSRRKTFVRIGVERRRVKAGRRALITVAVSPCLGRFGQRVDLLRGGQPNGTKRLDRTCTARFRRRIRHRASFRATSPQSDTYRTGTSRRLTIQVRRGRS